MLASGVLSLAWRGRFGSLKSVLCDLWFRMVSGKIPARVVIASAIFRPRIGETAAWGPLFYEPIVLNKPLRPFRGT